MPSGNGDSVRRRVLGPDGCRRDARDKAPIPLKGNYYHRTRKASDRAIDLGVLRASSEAQEVVDPSSPRSRTQKGTREDKSHTFANSQHVKSRTQTINATWYVIWVDSAVDSAGTAGVCCMSMTVRGVLDGARISVLLLRPGGPSGCPAGRDVFS